MNDDSGIEVLAETQRLRLLRRSGWEYVQRATASGIVIVVALTDAQKLLFVEQYRPPVNARVIEFPAGLAGDIRGAEHESLEEAARRELLEETGYAAESVRRAFTGPSAAGLTDEMATFFLAGELKKTSFTGGQPSEDITVHEVSLAEVERWLEACVQRGLLVGARVLAGLYLLNKRWLTGGSLCEAVK